jgi:hypothetical protein
MAQLAPCAQDQSPAYDWVQVTSRGVPVSLATVEPTPTLAESEDEHQVSSINVSVTKLSHADDSLNSYNQEYL